MGPAILEGAVEGDPSPDGVSAVRSPDFDEVYFIAVEFDGERGVWASSSLEPGGGPIFSVNSTAIQSTNWPGAATATDINSADPSVDAALACLG